jgi:hypothetical protein
VILLAAYYQHAEVGSSFFTEQSFFWLCGGLSVLIPIGFVGWEETTGSYPKGKRLNLNRPFHALYMWWMGYILLAGVRGLVYSWSQLEWSQILLTWSAFGFFLGWIATVFFDNKLPTNRVWKSIKRRYPDRTRIP